MRFSESMVPPVGEIKPDTGRGVAVGVGVGEGVAVGEGVKVAVGVVVGGEVVGVAVGSAKPRS